GLEVLRVRVRVVHRRGQRVEQIRLRDEFDASRSRSPYVHAPDERRDVGELEGYQVRELVLEVGQPQADPVLPELLIDTEFVAEALLGLQRRVREAREEQVVEGRRAEPRADLQRP